MENTDGTEITDRSQLPGSIYLQLQRKEKDNEAAVWEAVDYSGNISEKIGLKLLPSIVVHHPTFGLIPLWIWNNMWTAQQILKFGGSIGLWK